MGLPAERIEMEALELPLVDRARIATRLIASLDDDEGDEDDDPAEVERAWEEELRRRIDDLDSGRVQPVPYEEVMAKMRRIIEGG